MWLSVPQCLHLQIRPEWAASFERWEEKWNHIRESAEHPLEEQPDRARSYHQLDYHWAQASQGSQSVRATRAYRAEHPPPLPESPSINFITTKRALIFLSHQGRKWPSESVECLPWDTGPFLQACRQRSKHLSQWAKQGRDEREERGKCKKRWWKATGMRKHGLRYLVPLMTMSSLSSFPSCSFNKHLHHSHACHSVVSMP